MNAPIGLISPEISDVLISIKPKFVEKILSGEKKFEFRKAVFKTRPVRKIFVYASAPVQCIVASFEFDGIVSGTPERVWERCKEHAGIAEDAYFNYFDGKESAYSIKIKNLKIFKRPIRPSNHIPNFRPPQSYMYVDNKLEKILMGSL